MKQKILNILDRCTISIKENLNVVYLPLRKLNRKTYLVVNKYLEDMGGKWDKKEKGYIFEDYPVDILKRFK